MHPLISTVCIAFAVMLTIGHLRAASELYHLEYAAKAALLRRQIQARYEFDDASRSDAVADFDLTVARLRRGATIVSGQLLIVLVTFIATGIKPSDPSIEASLLFITSGIIGLTALLTVGWFIFDVTRLRIIRSGRVPLYTRTAMPNHETIP